MCGISEVSHLYNIAKSMACWKFIPSQSRSLSKPACWEQVLAIIWWNHHLSKTHFENQGRPVKAVLFFLKLLQIIFCKKCHLETEATLSSDSVCQPAHLFMYKYLCIRCKNERVLFHSYIILSIYIHKEFCLAFLFGVGGS